MAGSKEGNGWLTETVKEGESRKHPAFSKDVRRNKQRAMSDSLLS
jgi:hypothetical protein